MDWRITAGGLGLGMIYLATSLYRGRLVVWRNIERTKEPRLFWLNIVLFCICLDLILFGLGG